MGQARGQNQGQIQHPGETAHALKSYRKQVKMLGRRLIVCGLRVLISKGFSLKMLDKTDLLFLMFF